MSDVTQVENGVLFFDDTCHYCRAGIKRLRGVLGRLGVSSAPLADGTGANEMKLRWHDGAVYGGAEAIVFLAGRVWWARPIWLAAKWIPGVLLLFRIGYRFVAARRHCGANACAIPTAPVVNRNVRKNGWAVWLTLTVAALVFARDLEGWYWIWCLAAAMWLGYFIFDGPRFLTNRSCAMGYHPLTVVFITLVVIYGWAAINP